MTDRFDQVERSEIMSQIKGKHAQPEKLVRSLWHRMAYHFRLHVGTLPGKPDIVLPCHKRVVFVHSCFWHGHRNCKRAARSQSNAEFWDHKIDPVSRCLPTGSRAGKHSYPKLFQQGGHPMNIGFSGCSLNYSVVKCIPQNIDRRTWPPCPDDMTGHLP